MIRRLAIGPIADLPSWRWVGNAMSVELKRYYDVTEFGSFDSIPVCDAILVVKQRPQLSTIYKLHEEGVKIVFAPIDIYASASEVDQDRALLATCDLVLCHSEPLLNYLRPHCARISFVEHHGKYTLPRPAAFKPRGYVLWIGGLQYAPHLLQWLRAHPLPCDVKILTDLGNRGAALQARHLARQLGLLMEIGPRWLNGHEARPWTELEQLRMMQECKAAIDIKGSDFNQMTKPPTKAQKFVSSGIPFACNPDSAAYRYFRERGFELASPIEQERWFSREYWQETAEVAKTLRQTLSIEAVAIAYRDELEFLSGGMAPGRDGA